MAPKACPECGSRKWRRDGVTGNAVCEDGHVYQDFRSENLVMDATGITLQKRRVRGPGRVNRRKEQGQANKEYYHGADAEWLKVQAFQLLLRTQVQALSRLWHLPQTYEMIVRDLWAYQCSMCHLPPRPTANPDEQVNELFDMNTDKEIFADDKSDDGSSKFDSGDETTLDPDLLEELENLSEDDGARERNDDGLKRVKKKRPLRISDTLVCLIVGLWTIRFPILNVDMETLVNRNEIPFVDFGRTAVVPEEMSRRINRDTMLALCPGRCPPPQFLHVQCHKLARYIHSRHGVIIPEINLPPVSWRVISSLGGTPTTHTQVHRLLALIDVNFTLIETEPAYRGRRRRRSRGSISEPDNGIEFERTRRYDDIWLPELAIAAGWIIIMKMAYGLDDQPRIAMTKENPVVGLPLGSQWVEELEKRLKANSLNPSKRHLDHIDFTEMSATDMEQFLEQAENVLVKNRQPARNIPSSDAVNVFPLHLTEDATFGPERPNWDTYHASVHPTMHRLVASETSKDPLLPAERIRSYRASDFTGILPDKYEIVLKAAAEVVGVRPRDVSKVVEIFERRLEKRRQIRSTSGSRTGSASSSRSNRRSRVLG